MEANQATCLFAVESGSRAWGFPSANSDYDVRFVYWRHRDWYLSIEHHREVIEEIGDDDLDFAGWDLRKALKLAHKSNPSLHDWLATNEAYYRHPFFEEFQDLCRWYYDANACYHHFRSMAKSNFRDYSNVAELPFKKYFYIFRPLLCAKHIAVHSDPPPCLFVDLLDEFYPSGEVRNAIEELLMRKREGRETTKTRIIPILHTEIGRLFSESSPEPSKGEKKSTDRLNDFFRKVVLS